jgi:hypothetical protein
MGNRAGDSSEGSYEDNIFGEEVDVGSLSLFFESVISASDADYCGETKIKSTSQIGHGALGRAHMILSQPAEVGVWESFDTRDTRPEATLLSLLVCDSERTAKYWMSICINSSGVTFKGPYLRLKPGRT